MKAASRFLKRILSSALFFMIGSCGGFFLGRQLGALLAEIALPWPLLLAWLVVCVILGSVLQILLHEAGHLLLGLASGYQFCSFRIGSVLWMKQDGRLQRRRFSLAGTIGQCLLEPPEPVNGKIPYVLYNLGGSLLNLGTAALFAVLYWRTASRPLLCTMFLMLSVFGLLFALTNGIPLPVGAVNNDGHNAVSIGKCPEALRSFWLQMKVNAELTHGVRPKEMPQDWFPLPSEVPLDNSMTAAACILTFQRIMDQQNFPLARQVGETILQHGSGMVNLHRVMLQADLLYCELVGDNRPERIEAFQTKTYRKLMKAMRNYPSVLRVQYAYALLHDRDPAAAETLRERFEQIAKRYPYSAELESERELMLYARTVSDLRASTAVES